MLKQVALGPEAIAYVRWSLSSSQGTIATLVLALPLEAGSTFTFAPASADPAQLSRFRESLLGGIGTYEAVAAFAMSYLSGSHDRCLVFSDVFVSKGDPWLRESFVQYVTCGNEVYHFVPARNATEEAILQTIDNAKGYVTNGILTSSPFVPQMHSGDELDQTQLQAMAAATEYILVEAYDGEGFVIWARQ